MDGPFVPFRILTEHRKTPTVKTIFNKNIGFVPQVTKKGLHDKYFLANFQKIFRLTIL